MFQRLSPQLWLVILWGANQVESPAKVLKIRIGEAFPPTHATTCLCLELLRETLSTGSASSLLDVGCGTGVLGLAAAILGVPRVVGMDRAGGAATVALENARENHLEGSLNVVQGSTECVKGRFDLVVANLPWEVQMDKVGELDRLAASPGCLILSGFRDNQENPLLARYQKLGWSLSRRRIKDFQHPELPADMSFTWVAWALKRTCS